MIKNRLVTMVVWLASDRLQEKYVTNATVDEYILIDEVVEDVINEIEFIEINKKSEFTKRTAKILSGYKKHLVKYLDHLCREFDSYKTSSPENYNQIMFDDKHFKVIKHLSKDLLDDLGVSEKTLYELEDEEIYGSKKQNFNGKVESVQVNDTNEPNDRRK